MTHTLCDIAQALIKAAKAAGADAADAIAVDGTALSIEIRNGVLEHAERAEGLDIGLRALVGARQACVSASDAAPETLVQMAERAVAMARVAPQDPTIGLADPDQLSTRRNADGLDLFDPSPEPTPDQLQNLSRDVEIAALAVDGVTQVSNAGASYSIQNMALAASNGFAGHYARTNHGLFCVAIAGEGSGMERDYHGDSRTYATDMMNTHDIGQLAGARAVARLGAQKPPTGAFPVLFDERVSSTLIGHLIAACSGGAIVRGASWLRDALGDQILPKGLNLTEDPHRPRMGGTRPFDAEGLPTQRRDIVKDGVLTGWTLDLATARKLGLHSTGNASRGVSSPPSPSVTNLSLTQGNITQQGLMAEMGTGLWVTSLIGSSINPTTGDYSRGASGFWVENGEIAYPVNECTIAGNLRDMLRSLRPANDARAHLSRVVPSLLVEGMTIAGA
jgi:PmbA protein